MKKQKNQKHEQLSLEFDREKRSTNNLNQKLQFGEIISLSDARDRAFRLKVVERVKAAGIFRVYN